MVSSGPRLSFFTNSMSSTRVGVGLLHRSPFLTMPPGVRKLALTTHVMSSVGWLGAVAAFLALAIGSLTSQNAQRVRASYLAMEPVAWFVIVPFSLAALATGLVQSLGTTWGLFRHYWVLLKLLLTLVAAVVLFQLEPISYLADVAAVRALAPDDLRTARISLVGPRRRWTVGAARAVDPVGVQAARPDPLRAAPARGTTRVATSRRPGHESADPPARVAEERASSTRGTA